MRAEASRRQVLAGGLGLAGIVAASGPLAACDDGRPLFAGSLGGADQARGHRLRGGDFPAPQRALAEVPLVIAGGGVAGLAAAWRLAEAGFQDFVLLELEDQVGGNARAGRNAISAFPLGAHYLPVPNREARALRIMLERFGIITGHTDDGPVYDPYQLCADLESRLFWRGQWQEGLYPTSSLTPADIAQRDRFLAHVAYLSQASGMDGRPAFAIPMACSSRDPAFTDLDGESFAAWLDRQGYTSPVLRAHLRYGCRDDYGTEPEDLSAWAGLHYFAGRRGWAADGAGARELTWPEGNGRLVSLMAAAQARHIRTGQVVHRVARQDDAVLLDSFDVVGDATTRYRAQGVILAMPHFIAARVAPGLPPADGFSYAPWVVANVSVSRPPRGPGTPLAWDNVSAGSESLGYVVATHQDASAASGPTVLTWYMPLSTLAPAEARRLLQERPLAAWQALVRDDLLTMNPDLAGAITGIDIWRWGHAMARPVPGFLSDPARLQAQRLDGPVFQAHADLSGLSLFEEAHYRGVAAAEAALAMLGHASESLI
ncbi:FAD-dependent oxidoreductase [Zavarzinia sp. CC-PAN008]|uniref:FAD-dependent oxidoreductase n=1 Tax=Zavarzinia sp. CC-PAN008 TaxID=3243332 RepID=UPI003F743D19